MLENCSDEQTNKRQTDTVTLIYKIEFSPSINYMLGGKFIIFINGCVLTNDVLEFMPL